jgi:Zn-dependent protease with chaperone function
LSLGWFGRGLMLALYAGIRGYQAFDAVFGTIARLVRPAGSRGLRQLLATHLDVDEPDAGVGPILTRHDAAGLFHQLERIAAAMGTDFPDEVRLAYLPACGVVDVRIAGDKEPRQVLIVGLPCLQIWTSEELGAVLTHELAHLKQGDAAYCRKVLQFSTALGQALEQLDRRRRYYPQNLLARAVHAVLAGLSASVSRAMEFRADRWSANLWGPRPLTSALEKLAVVQPVFQQMLGRFDPRTRGGQNVFDFFEVTWKALRSEQYSDLRRRLVLRAAGGWFDPHPALADRIRRIARMGTRTSKWGNSPSAQTKSASPAIRLLRNPRALKAVLHNHLYIAQRRPNSVFQRFRYAE